jgi:hypothetical protein
MTRSLWKLFGATVLVLSASNASGDWGEWAYNPGTDPMTDKNLGMAVIAIREERSHIVVRCDGSDRFDIFISVGEYLGSKSGPVTFRVDSQPAIDAGRWGINTEGTSVYVPERKRNEMLRYLKSGHTIIFKIHDFRGTQHFAEFPLAGSSAAIKQLECLK